MTDVLASSHTRSAEDLLAAVRRHRERFEGAARQAELERTLPADVVALLRESRLFWLKTPVGLGGAELDPLEFCDVLEEIAYYDASAGWAAMVGNGCTGIAGGWLPDDGVAEVFGSADDPPVLAGQITPRGTAVPVPGGYTVTGRWGFCSGILHSGWLLAGCAVEGAPGEMVVVVVPKSETTVHDNWHVAGLQGTGSCDVSVAEVFVPARRALDWSGGARPRRGGGIYRQPVDLFVSNELAPVTVGIARRAIDDMYELAGRTARLPGGPALSERAAFQKDIAHCECRLRAARLLYRDAVERVWAATTGGEPLGAADVAAVRAQHTHVVEECVDVVVKIIRYAGGRALALSHPLQRHLRNLTAAAQHAYISDELYEIAGKARLAERNR
ncbi:acyl-CoA dehydrogenase family protein [Pseudonocardia humida]|uniref:Acyl-CoA dehydrogenase family protein n=1 Tax=Pseudonocardia humida TaxID=2800819 RepID=A0ABT1A0A5_9PSEU|nr:acyl-CoA dehydrogenase family protein [Pseudonocardia humida]MCO1656430.1 acyl-CoA dehydrogenase family protein [Pseudonocardia humida]